VKKLLKTGDRIEVIKPKLSWNGKRVMAKVGHKGTVDMDESVRIPDYAIRVFLDGQGKGIWIKPSYLKKDLVPQFEKRERRTWQS
jgi:hypothetical protein